MKELALSGLFKDIKYSRMVRIERYKPVTQLIKERKAFHLREASEIDV